MSSVSGILSGATRALRSPRLTSVANQIRSLKAHTIVRSISKRPVVIFATRRGGSTLLADVVAGNRGVWFANEPFAVVPFIPGFAAKRRLLPAREHSQYFNLDGDDLKQFENYAQGLLRAEYSELGTCRHVKFPYFTDRVCLKLLNAPMMLDWFLDNTNSEVLFLMRHPASQALSVIRQGWPFGVEAYFRQQDAVAHLFSDDQYAFAVDILSQKDPWKIAILDWVVNTHCGRNSKSDTLIRVHYEDLVFDPEPFVEDVLYGRLGLVELDRMKAIFRVPSNSSALSTVDTRNAILEGRRSDLLRGWSKSLSDDDKRQAQTVLDKFEVREYNMYTPVPIPPGLSA